jgi:hypothetical protein
MFKLTPSLSACAVNRAARAVRKTHSGKERKSRNFLSFFRAILSVALEALPYLRIRSFR